MTRLFLIWALLFESINLTGQVVCKHFESNYQLLQTETFLKQKKQPSVVDIVHQRIEITADPSVLAMRGKVTTTFVNRQSPLTSLKLDLDNQMKVDSILYNGVPVAFTHSNHSIGLQFPQSIMPAALDSFTVYYSGDPTKSRYQAYRVDKHGRNSTLAPIIWTLSQPYGAQDWWPCTNTLDDKIDSLDFIIQCPKGNVAVSHGLLISKDSMPGDWLKYHWRHRYPMATYLMAFAVTNYTLYSDTVHFKNGKPLPVLHYVYPEYLSTSLLQTPEIIPVFHLFDSLFGEYPFMREKYGHAMFGRGGGMEHQTISFMSDFSFDLMAHELAHQWFGNVITCQSWRDIWLNEGFASYLTALCYNFLQPAKFPTVMGDIKNSVMESNDGSVYVNDTTSVNRIFNGRLTYDKGAMLLHLLRLELGDSLFFKSIKNYITEPEFINDFVGSAGFQKFIENQTGRDLSLFFAQWLYGEGFPIHTIEWKQDEGLVAISISQTTSHPSVPYFHTTVPLKLTGENRDTLIYLTPGFSGEELWVRLPFDIQEISFDPLNQTLGKAQVVNGGTLNRKIAIFPNPSQGQIQVNVPGLHLEKIEIFELSGKTIQQITTESTGGLTMMKIDLSHLKNGSYLIRSKTEKGYFMNTLHILR